MKITTLLTFFLLVSLLVPASAQDVTGAVPRETQAEAVQRTEAEFQKKLADLRVTVEGLEKRLDSLKTQTSAPEQLAVEPLDKDSATTEQELNNALALSPSQIAQLQVTEVRERLKVVRDGVRRLGERWSGGTVFGLDFFENAPPVQSMEQWAVPDTYRLRVNDTLRVVVLSNLGAQNEYERTIAPSGGFDFPGAGWVSATGKSLKALNADLTKRISSRFRQLRVEATVVKLSTIQVQVTGAVARPGTYTLPGMATVLNAVYQAGGPTKSGTFRKVSLVRSGEPARTIDLYDFLLKGSKQQDVPLREGDLLFVPPIGATVTVDGEVIRPARYEPKFPTTLSDALEMAGGLKSGGYAQTVQVERVQDNQYRVLLSEPVGTQKAAFALQPGDVVTVFSVQPLRTNQVEISGPVAAPGTYGLSDGMRVSDLVRASQGLAQNKEIYLSRGDILRIDPIKGTELITFDLGKALAGDGANDIPLGKLDRVFLYEPDQVEFRPRVVTLTGAVAKPGVQKRNSGMKVRDLIAQGGGVMPNAYLSRADLKRYTDDEKTILMAVDVQSALAGDPAANLELEDRDELTVYTIEQVRWQDRKVRIEGAVQRPGEYPRSEGMRVSDLIFASGGLTPEAGEKMEVTHRAAPGTNAPASMKLASMKPAGADDLVLCDGDVVTIPAVNLHARNPELVYITGEVAYPGPYPLPDRNCRLADLVARAGGLTDLADVKGMLFLRLHDNLENKFQRQDADVLIQKMKVFADKEFQAQIAKLGLSSPQAASQVGQALEKITQPQAQATTVAQAASISGPESVTLGPTGYEGRIAKIAESMRISVDLRKALRESDSTENLALCEGDRIFIPKLTNVVTVMGAVMQPRAFALAVRKSPDYYIERSGGYAPDSSKDHVVVVRSNGEALPKGRVRSIESGDIIVVPTKGFIDYTRKWERTESVTKILSEVLSSVFILTKL